MKYTSAEAAKLLRGLNEEEAELKEEIRKKSTFLAAMGEDPKTVRPEFNLKESLRDLNRLDERIRSVKHALNVFNSTTVIPEINMTIDQALVYIPQLTYKKQLLGEMASRLPKQRDTGSYMRTSSVVDYLYANYDIEEAKKELRDVSEKLAQVQLALDLANSTMSFEIPE